MIVSDPIATRTTYALTLRLPLVSNDRSGATKKSQSRRRASRKVTTISKIRRNEQTRSDSQVTAFDREVDQNQSKIGEAADCLREGREDRAEHQRRFEEGALPRARTRRSRRRHRDRGEDENDDEPCRGNFDRAAGDSRGMAQHPNPESARGHHARAENFEPDLGTLAQHFNERHPKGMGDNNLAPLSTSELQRAFPFQATPSGNLKIVPNQVVFESKKVSVLVAEPRHAKVNVKAEQVGRLSHSVDATQQGNCIGGNNKQQPPRQPMTIDLPPGVTPSTVDRLQAQRKLPSVHHQPELAAGELGARPRTQPFNRARATSQLVAQQLQQTAEDEQAGGGLRAEPVINDVPLASLGFTTEQPIDWNNVTLPEKTDLYRELSRRITQYKNADCIVRIGNDEFHCHLLVLQSYSSFFDDRNVKEMDLTGSTVTSRAFSIIYDWMISPTSESCHLLRRDNILEIFLAAQYLAIKELEEQCWAFIDNDELFCEDTAFLLYLEARKIGNTAVMELMVPRIMKFFLMLVSTKDFLELSVEELCLLLRSNYICVNSEMEILMSAVRWLMYDWESRKQYMIEVMKCVRFGLIAPWQLVDVKRNPENPEFMELMSYPEIQKMVDDGLAFVIIKYWYGNQTEDYYHWIDLLGLSEPTNRNWAGEDKHYVTYREFLLYLEEYQKTKVLDFKNKKSHKPSPPHSPPKEDSPLQTTPPVRSRTNYQSTKIADMSAGGASMRLPMQQGMPSNNNNKPMPPCMMMPPEMLSHYFNDATNEVGQGHKMSPFHVERLSAGAEQPSKTHKANLKPKREKKKESHIRISEDNCPNPRSYFIEVQPSLYSTSEHSTRKLQSIKCLYKRKGSLKSEDEAATAIQAMYRGYKARKRFKDSSNKTLKLITVELCSSSEQQSKERERSKNLTALIKGEQTGKTESFQTVTQYQVEEARSDEGESTDLSIKTIMPPAFADTNDDLTITSSREIHQDDNLLLPGEDGQTASDNARVSKQQIPEGKGLVPSTSGSQSTKKSRKHKPSKIPHCELLAMVGLNRTDAKTAHSSQKSHNRGEVILVFGGIDPHTKYGRKGSSGKDVYCYRPDENRWTFVGEMPEPRHHHSVAYLTGRVYLAGGTDPRKDDAQRRCIALDTVWSYDPRAKNWFSEPSMLTPRQNFGLVVSDGKIYAIGGQNENGIALKSAEVYDPTTRKWKEIQSMNIPRIGPACLKFEGFIWVAGGLTKFKREPLTREVECYDPSKNAWTKSQPLKTPRCFSSLHAASNRLFIVGGAGETTSEDGSSNVESIGCIDVWDAKECAWQTRASISIARHGHTVSSIGDQMMVLGGVTTLHMKALKSIECYCYELDKWIKGISPLPFAISGHGSISLPSSHLDAGS